MRIAAVFLFILGSGCSHRYADFGLPSAAGNPVPVTLEITADKLPSMEPAPSTWEGVDVLNPSVIRHSGRLLNIYSAFDGKTWHTGIAESADGEAGKQWRHRARILSPDQPWEGRYIASNGSALSRPDGEIRYWYQAGEPVPRIGLARSRDGGRTWIKHPDPVVPAGPRGSWDERGVADPYVIEAQGGVLYIIFLGQNRARQQRLGLARSFDGGVTWEKRRANPILDFGEEGAFDENGLGEPAVWQSHGRWWMLYTGRDRHENRRIGLAYSQDGAGWKRWSEQAVMSGVEPWNSRVVCDPTVMVAGDVVRIWYGGGDVAHPAENIHGRIGYAELRMMR
jgi:predicted GH43/DUF377 family glycosyl hydrolase